MELPKLKQSPLGEIRFKQSWEALLNFQPGGAYFTPEEKLRLSNELMARLDMYQVVDHLGGELRYGAVPQKAHCIFHQDGHQSAKVTDRWFTCYSGCGGGGIIWVLKKAWGDCRFGEALYRANLEFDLKLDTDPEVIKRVYSPGLAAVVTRKEEPRKSVVTDKMRVHRVYQAVLAYLPLLPRHSEALRTKRGLSTGSILTLKEKGYRSWKHTWEQDFVKALAIKVGAEHFYGVPGFWREGDDWRFSCPEGMVFPVTDINSTTRALMVRNDHDDSEKKYIYVSSAGYYNGTSASYSPHFIRNGPSFKEVWIVEGVLKADICSTVLKDAGLIIGLPGLAASLKDIIDILKSLPNSTVNLAIDADWRSKEAVKNGLTEISHKLSAVTPSLHLANWSPLVGKGLDDVLVAGKKDAISLIPLN